MATNLPVSIALSRNEDLRLDFEFVTDEGAPVSVPAGTWTLTLRGAGRVATFLPTAKEGLSNVLEVVSLLADVGDLIPVGSFFVGDLVLTNETGSFVYGSFALTRSEVVQTTDQLGPRVVRVVRGDGAIVRLQLGPANVFASFSGVLLQMAIAYTNQSTRFIEYLTTENP